MNKIEIQQIFLLNILMLSGIFINKENLALGFLEILNVSFGNEQNANTTKMKLQTHIIAESGKAMLCGSCFLVQTSGSLGLMSSKLGLCTFQLLG